MSKKTKLPAGWSEMGPASYQHESGAAVARTTKASDQADEWIASAPSGRLLPSTFADRESAMQAVAVFGANGTVGVQELLTAAYKGVTRLADRITELEEMISERDQEIARLKRQRARST